MSLEAFVEGKKIKQGELLVFIPETCIIADVLTAIDVIDT
jgi:hypothetical protein